MDQTTYYRADSATRVSYCLIVLSAVVPIGVANSSWVGMATGAGVFGLLTVLPMIPLYLFGIFRVYSIARSKEALSAPEALGFLQLIRKLGVFLIYFGGLVAVLGFIAGPLMHVFLKQKTESGAEFFVVGLYLSLAGKTGWLGLTMFEISRLVSFERRFQSKVQRALAPGLKSKRDFQNTSPMHPL